MYKSLETFLKEYPFFFDKRSDSNFTKTKKVFNNRLQDLNNDIFKVYLASKLEKHLLIWKVQEQPHYFDIHFHVSLPYIKSVEIIRNYDKVTTQQITLEDGTTKNVTNVENIDEVIYSESFNYDDNINKFEYLYEGYSKTIIPEERYKINVETWEEYILTKGFPENDTPFDDEYDHDYSLDNIGQLYNVPRKNYIRVDESKYAKTEPPYNINLTEDDYHYMQRLFYYINHLKDTPLPVLEIYKLFGIPAEMLNRDRLIARMIDINRHSTNGIYNSNWVPQRWEHKDQWCSYTDGEILLFLANVNNAAPIQGQDFTFDFKILNSLAEDVYNTESYNLINETVLDNTQKPFLIVPYKDGKIVPGTVLNSDAKWTLNTEDINHEPATFIFKLFKNQEQIDQDLILGKGTFQINEGDIVSEEIRITVRGCSTADWYVDAVNGKDTNNGTSRTTAFKTVDKALKSVDGEKNVITLLPGEHTLSKTYKIIQNTNIITCPNDDVLVWCNNPTFFRVSQDTSLYMQNIRLRHKCCVLYAPDTLFSNNNNLDTPLEIKVHKKYCMIETKIEYTVPDDLIYSDKFTITGKLLTVDDNLPVANETVDLYIDGAYHSTVTTNTKGVFTVNNLSFNDVKKHTFQILHHDHKNSDGKTYCRCQSEILSRTVRRIPTSISLAISPATIYYNDNYTISGVLTDENNKGIASKSLKVYVDDELVNTVNTDSSGKYTVTFKAAIVGSHTVKIIYDELCRYLESEKSQDYTINLIPTTLTASVDSQTKLTNKLTTANRSIHALIKSFSIHDHKNKIPPGTLQLLEGNVTLETIQTTGTAFNTIPGSEGTHTYTLKYVADYGYESKTITLTTKAVKTGVVLSFDNTFNLFAKQKSIELFGSIKTEDGLIFDYGTLKIGLSSLENQVFSNGQFSKTFNKLSVGQYTCTLSYAGNDYFKAASITFPFWVIEAEYVVHDLTQSSEHQDVTILTSAPSNLSGYAEDDLILIDDDIGNYDELILEDTTDTTGLGDDDTILLNDETDDIEVLIVELEDDEED